MEIILLLAIIPSLIIAIIIYLSDKKEREPFKELIKAFLLGIISTIITLIVSMIFNIGTIDLDNIDMYQVFIYAFIQVALIEELSKWLCSYAVVCKNSNFNYMYDGIVYFTFVSLGFATLENIIYALDGGLTTVLLRTVTTVPAHVFFAVASGYYFALSVRERNKGNIKKKNRYLILSILLPIILHGFYDFCLLTGNYIFLIVYLVFVVSLYIFSIDNIKKMERIDHPLDSKDIHCRKCGRVINSDKCPYCGFK